MTTEENFVQFLLDDASIAESVKVISYNKVPQNKDTPYVFFQQAGAIDDPAMDDSPGVPTRAQYAIEAIDDNPSGAIALKNLIQARCHKYRGAFGDASVKAIFAEDVDDKYEANGTGDDSGLHSAALVAEVVL